MANIHDFTGSVDVNTNITPTTREEIKQVSPEKWNTMSTYELVDERTILSNRVNMAYQCGSEEIALQIQKSINHIDAILQSHIK